MRFKMLLFLFSLSICPFLKPMNPFDMPQITEETEDDDLGFIEKTKNRFKKHPIRSGIYLAVATVATGSAIFAYKNNPEEFWSAWQGLKEATGDFWRNLRGKSKSIVETRKNEYQTYNAGQKNDPFIVDHNSTLNENGDSITSNQTAQSSMTVEELLKDPKHKSKVKENVREEIITEHYSTALIPDLVNELHKTFKKMYDGSWSDIGTYVADIESWIKTAKELNKNTGNSNDTLKYKIEQAESAIIGVSNIKNLGRDDSASAQNQSDVKACLVHIKAVNQDTSKLADMKIADLGLEKNIQNKKFKSKIEKQNFKRHWQWRYIPISICSIIAGLCLRRGYVGTW